MIMQRLCRDYMRRLYEREILNFLKINRKMILILPLKNGLYFKKKCFITFNTFYGRERKQFE